jgi:hypothetical protein
MPSVFDKQIQNRNFLSPVGFKFNLARTPKVDFFANSANIPGINLGAAIQPTYLKDIPIPGDKLSYDDFDLKFIVDENLENYVEIHNWMRGLGYPENISEYNNWKYSDITNTSDPNISDGTLIIYSSNNNHNISVKFQGLWPTSLSTITFDSTDTDVQYVTASVSFKYTIYNIINYEPG